MVDYCEGDISHHPRCLHGPALLFSRKTNGRKFFTCSAFRDRKKCRYFRWIDEPSSDHDKVIEAKSFAVVLETFRARRNEFQKLLTSSKSKCYCYTCDMFVGVQNKRPHLQHDLKMNVDSTTLLYPTLIMKPIQQSKGESQFHFADNTVKTFLKFLSDLDVTGVLCVGCPSLHENILNSRRDNCVRSLLLDIDHRYLQFYAPDQFQMFNMFNCHFFDENGQSYIEAFARSGQIAIVVDPPFGGRIEPLAYSFGRLISAVRTKKCRVVKDVLVLLILPYFMEPAVKRSFPHFHMLDYKVEYRNHRQFKNKDGRGSTVRMFTNYSPSLFKLPAEEGYKYCAECDRWVYKENRHCFECNACTSKNGGSYKHCAKCRKCVKITWSHCDACKLCKLNSHNCASNTTNNECNEVPPRKRRRN